MTQCWIIAVLIKHWFSSPSTDLDFLLRRFLTRYQWKTYLQHTVVVSCGDICGVYIAIKGECSYKTTATIFSHNPFRQGKAFWWCVRNGELISFDIDLKMILDATGSKDQHFVAVLGFINIDRSSLT